MTKKLKEILIIDNVIVMKIIYPQVKFFGYFFILRMNDELS
jgi:hypothetical protein